MTDYISELFGFKAKKRANRKDAKLASAPTATPLRLGSDKRPDPANLSVNTTSATVSSESPPSTVPYPRPQLPRLFFSGKYYTDPSTINNNVKHYDVDKFRPSLQLPDDGINDNGYWHPDGTATFAFVDCIVDNVSSDTTFASLPSGFTHSTNGAINTSDSIIGRPVVYNQRKVYGKISDLDPQMQTVSELFGVRVEIGSHEDGPDGPGFSALLEPTCFRDMWEGVENPPDAAAYIKGFSAVYQGVLKLEAYQAADSQFLAACQPFIDTSKQYVDPQTGTSPFPNGALSIRFRVDYYDNDPKSPTFCYGNCSAFIQPWLPENPLSFDAGRCLSVVPEIAGSTPPMANKTYAYVQQSSDETPISSLFVDMIDSLYRTAPGVYKDIGVVMVGYFEGDYQPSNYSFQPLYTVSYTNPQFETIKGGVLEIALTAESLAKIESNPLGIARADDANGTNLQILLAEDNDGYFVRADRFVFRLEPTTATTSPQDLYTKNIHFYATYFGKRAAAVPICIGLDSSGMVDDGMGGIGPTPGIPASALVINGETPGDEDAGASFMTTATTDENGFASVALKGGNCQNSRGYVDGQVYGIRYDVGSTLPEVSPSVANSTKVNVRLFNVYDGPKNGRASWLVDILPIFKQFANLYPAMDHIVRLDDYGSVVKRRPGLIRVFSTDINDPMYMPTTRDLSAAKRDMILRWLRDEDGDETEDELNFMNETVDDVKVALQTVIELEHSTMPPYLTALYSIKPGYNAYIADLLRDIAVEEMLHLGLACNILISIGGAPNIKKMGFVPKYPGPLPGGLRSGLVARLRKCSVEQIEAFMAIEMPYEETLSSKGNVATNGTVQDNQYTIGWAYTAIATALENLHTQGAIQFPDDTGKPDTDPTVAWQVDNVFDGKLKKIRNINDALEVIDMIKEQGEGSSLTNPSQIDPETGKNVIDPDTGLPLLSHYFRFQEVVRGRRIVPEYTTEDGTTTTEPKYTGFSYTGPKVALDPDGVHNMQDDPNLQEQPIGSLQRERMESFSRKYQALLNGIDRAFNGDPGHLRECFGLMFQLTIAAQPLMKMPALNLDGTSKSDGTTCGVSFQVPFE